MGEFSGVGFGALTGFLVSLLGFQINLVALHRGIDRGRHATFFVQIGAAFGDMVFAFLSLASAEHFLNHPEIAGVMKWVGAGILFWVGGRILFQGPKIEKKRKRNPAKNFLLGFLIVLFNPSLLVVWIGIVAFLHTHFPEAHILQSPWLFLAGFLAGATVWALILSIVVLHNAKKMEAGRLQGLSRLCALALLAAAVYLIVKKF